MQSALLRILFLYNFGPSPRFKHILMFEHISNCAELCLKVFLEFFPKVFLEYTVWDSVTDLFISPQYPSFSCVLETTTTQCVRMQLRLVCAKYLDPSCSPVPPNRATSGSRQNTQVCSMLCKSHGPDASERDRLLLPRAHKVLRAVASIWGVRGTALGKVCLLPSLAISGSVNSAPGLLWWPWIQQPGPDPSSSRLNLSFPCALSQTELPLPLCVGGVCGVRGQDSLLSSAPQLPPPSVGDCKASHNQQISLWLHRAADQVPGAQLPLMDGNRGSLA